MSSATKQGIILFGSWIGAITYCFLSEHSGTVFFSALIGAFLYKMTNTIFGK